MDRSAAIKKLTKLLGPKFAYEVMSSAPTKEEREVAQSELRAAFATSKAASEKMDARKLELLKADPEYQRLLSEYTTVRERQSELQAIALTYKITVGTVDVFFQVKAQGDSWEEVIETISKKQAA